MTAWNVQIPDGAIGSISVQDSHPYCLENPHYLVIDATEPAVGIGVDNEGFGEGIYIEAGKRYIFSCYAACDGRPLRFEVSLRSADGTMYEKRFFRFQIPNGNVFARNLYHLSPIHLQDWVCALCLPDEFI